MRGVSQHFAQRPPDLAQLIDGRGIWKINSIVVHEVSCGLAPHWNPGAVSRTGKYL